MALILVIYLWKKVGAALYEQNVTFFSFFLFQLPHRILYNLFIPHITYLGMFVSRAEGGEGGEGGLNGAAAATTSKRLLGASSYTPRTPYKRRGSTNQFDLTPRTPYTLIN